MQPTIVRVGKRCYRKNPINAEFAKNYAEEDEFEPIVCKPSSLKCSNNDDEPCR